MSNLVRRLHAGLKTVPRWFKGGIAAYLTVGLLVSWFAAATTGQGLDIQTLTVLDVILFSVLFLGVTAMWMIITWPVSMVLIGASASALGVETSE